MEITCKRPQVLLLGNGIIRAYSSLAMSWKEMLKRIGTHSIPDEISIPMPLEIVLRTGDHVNMVLERHNKELYGSVDSQGFMTVLRSLLAMGFDHILTTNYSYELEQAALGEEFLSDKQLSALTRHSPLVVKRETSFLLHTYNEVSCEGHENRIWHIHGEAMLPDSIVLGHLYYGNLLSRCREYLMSGADGEISIENGREINSWVDAFMLGDVYTLGFGYDFSEMDLWWLLDCKKIYSPDGGILYYYRPVKDDAFDVKSQLLKDYGACIIDLGEQEPRSDITEYYRGFYNRAMEDIRLRIQVEPHKDSGYI